MNDKGVCRTAPATPGLLKMFLRAILERAIVKEGKCHGGQVSCRSIVTTGMCHGGQLSHRASITEGFK